MSYTNSIGGFQIGISAIGTLVTNATYTGLVTSEHADKPNFLASIVTAVQPFVDAANVVATLPSAYDLDLAVGAQLDTVGLWVGVTRYLIEPLPGIFFSWNTVGLGWGQGVWHPPYVPTDGLVALDDPTYRLLLKGRIIANAWDGTIAGAFPALNQIFNSTTTPGTTFYIQDNYDMTMNFVMTGTFPGTLFATIFTTGLLGLKPVGVDVTYVNTSV